MKAKFAVVLVLLAVVAGAGAGWWAQESRESAKPYTVSVRVKPGEKKGAYDCLAVIKDAKTGEKVFEDTFGVALGDQTKVSTIKPGWLVLTVTVAVDKEGKKATYKFLAEKDDKVLQQDEGQLAIE